MLSLMCAFVASSTMLLITVMQQRRAGSKRAYWYCQLQTTSMWSGGAVRFSRRVLQSAL